MVQAAAGQNIKIVGGSGKKYNLFLEGARQNLARAGMIIHAHTLRATRNLFFFYIDVDSIIVNKL